MESKINFQNVFAHKIIMQYLLNGDVQESITIAAFLSFQDCYDAFELIYSKRNNKINDVRFVIQSNSQHS